MSSIDAATYDFNRVSVRDALIAAHGRGVVVRVVTDDDSYEDLSYHPFYAALDAAGIGWSRMAGRRLCTISFSSSMGRWLGGDTDRRTPIKS